MDPILVNLETLTDYLIAAAAESEHGRASRRIDLDHQRLRMTAIGFSAGGELPEHDNQGEAVLQVVRGRIRLGDATRTIEVSAGELARIPDGRHRVEARGPSVILLTAMPLADRGDASAESAPSRE